MDILGRLQVVVILVGVYAVIWRFIHKRMCLVDIFGDIEGIILTTVASVATMVAGAIVLGGVLAVGHWIIYGG